jgi:hypothetical protein
MSWGFAVTHPDNDDLGFLALCLTGSAGVAVLGARRPQVFAWNFVVLGLAGVMTLPLAEGLVIQVHSFNIERKVFLGGILVVALGNYLATRYFAAVLAIGAVCFAVFMRIAVGGERLELLRHVEVNWLASLALAAAPWLAWRSPTPVARDRLDADWFEFRDRFGFVWGSRVREQFNAAAKNAELPMRIGWRGQEPHRCENPPQIDEACSLFNALTIRFELTNDETLKA